ncbi:MAG: cupin domain-containing protein [Candidatus Rokubacteria bacterium]|nr:cupin domain-containing protein [Candidatus Rokubacteria bacterium]
MRLGEVLRQLRKERKIPLADMARKLALSAGYLSQIERDLAVPSIQTLAKIAEAFDTTLARLFEQAEGQAPRRMLVRREDRKAVLYQGSTSVNQLLVPDLKGQLEVILSRIRPGTKSPVYQHAGEEFGVVIKGTLTLWVGEERFDLRQGDAIRFPATIPHRWRKVRGRAEVLWAITPPAW